MRRLAAIFGSAVFPVIAPGTLAGYVPWTITRWHMASPLLGFFPFRILGVLLIAAGLPVLLDSFARFALLGPGHTSTGGSPEASGGHRLVSLRA